MGITVDKTNVDLGQGNSYSMMRSSLIFSSLTAYVSCFASSPLPSSFVRYVQKPSTVSSRHVTCSVPPEPSHAKYLCKI